MGPWRPDQKKKKYIESLLGNKESYSEERGAVASGGTTVANLGRSVVDKSASVENRGKGDSRVVLRVKEDDNKMFMGSRIDASAPT